MSDSLPQHIAVIMDGNGRWAKARGLPRVAGHKQGAEAARQIVKDAHALGVKYITLFGFSAENWSRPDSEVRELMNLLRGYLKSETAELHKNNARLRVIGDRSALDGDIVSLIDQAETVTRDNSGICVVMALNYGGQQEILQAAKQAAKQAIIAGDVDQFEDDFTAGLYTHDMPDPDLLIRTSGEMRISNFLLWQCAYSEFYFTPVLWPDFNKNELEKALQSYAQRDRRYGGLKNAEGVLS